MTIIISRAGIEGTDIKPDSPGWVEWFVSQPEGTKIQFAWTDDSFKEQKFTAYRRKRYWEAQKRISGKLRNTTIKPGEATYEALRQMGLKLTSYNWADKFEYEESGNQTFPDQSSQTGNKGEELEELRARIAGLEEENRRLKHELKVETEISERNFRERNEMWSRFQEAHLKNQQIQAKLNARGEELALKSLECSEG